MATFKVFSLEGDINGELGGIVGESTLDTSTSLFSDFEVETASVFIGAGKVGIFQRVFIEADTQGQTLTCIIIIDGVETILGTFSTTTKTVTEFAVNRTGYIGGIRLFAPGTNITKRLEVSAIECEIYVPMDADRGM